MRVSFTKLTRGATYSRQQLAQLWGYRGYEAIARGLVTPRHDNKLILFITEGDRQQQTPQKYSNQFDGRTLKMQGPDDHFAESRLVNSDHSRDEVHLFHRAKHQHDFTYCGQLRLVASRLHRDKPSEFTLQVI